MARKKASKKAAKKKSKLTKKGARRTAQARGSSALPSTESIPEGFKQLGGSYAETWNVEEQPLLQGVITGEVKEVEITRQKEKVMVRCCELTENETEKRFTVWESAALESFIDKVAAEGIGGEYFLRYDGLGKKKRGQNAPTVFTVAFAE